MKPEPLSGAGDRSGPRRQRAAYFSISVLTLSCPIRIRPCYCARLLSAQKETVFRKSHYEKLRKVYSIWICTDVPHRRRNTITGYQLAERNFVGQVCEKTANYDLISVIMVCLGRESDENYKGILKLLRDEFGLDGEQGINEGVLEMCNLSRGVEARGIKKGRREGRREGLTEGLSRGRREGLREGILSSVRSLMKSMNFSVNEALNALEIPAEERQGYIDALAHT